MAQMAPHIYEERRCESASLFLVVVVYSLILSRISGHAFEQSQTTRDKSYAMAYISEDRNTDDHSEKMDLCDK